MRVVTTVKFCEFSSIYILFWIFV